MTALHVLPRDVLARCLEFLPFDQALEVKQVSKVVRSAARRALTGRWRSIMFVEEQGLDLIENSTPSEWSEPRRVEVRRALATFRAAWELDPGLVVLEIAQWRDELHGQFLALVEPNTDGLSRVVAACERTYCFKTNSIANTYRGIHIPYRVAWPGDMLIAWSERVGRQLRLLVDDDMDEELIEQGLYIKDSEEAGFWGRKLFGAGLGEWADPELAAYFVFHLVERLPEPTGFEFVDFDDYWDWSANWWDRYKSSDFLSTAQEIIARESQWP